MLPDHGVVAPSAGDDATWSHACIQASAVQVAPVTAVLPRLAYGDGMDMHQEPGIRHLTYDQLVASSAGHECPGIGREHICVRIAAVADLPTAFGTFHIVGFWNDRDGKDHVAIVKGDPFGKSDVPVRLHSECLTGDALGSLRCDCRDQLTSALRSIGQQETGMVLYLRQEGRGIGLLNKLRAYGLQDEGLDTVDANEALGFRDDERDYSIAAHMLELLQVRSIQLMTNNPRKVQGLRDLGIDVSGRIPHVIPATEYNRAYLETKALRSGHLLPNGQDGQTLEQLDTPIVEGMGSDAAGPDPFDAEPLPAVDVRP
jgi:GTP cyclohydrolase II